MLTYAIVKTLKHCGSCPNKIKSLPKKEIKHCNIYIVLQTDGDCPPQYGLFKFLPLKEHLIYSINSFPFKKIIEKTNQYIHSQT